MGSAELSDMTGPGLTPRQRMIIDAIEDSMQRCGYPPTLREIGEAAGLASTSSVSHQLSTLEKKGYLSRGVGRPRTAVVRPLTDPDIPEPADQARSDTEGQQVARVPVVGRIAAGGPILAQELFEDRSPCPGSWSATASSSCSRSSATR